MGTARYNEQLLTIRAELPLTDRELHRPSSRILRLKPAYYAPNPEINGTVDFETDLDCWIP